MKKITTLITAILLTACISFPVIAGVAPANESMSDEQLNAISMLNYITVLTQEINNAKNSRLYMEEAYSNLVNNTYPNAVDSFTLSQLTGLLDTMESYRMVDVKRDRLQYIYEHNKAQAIRSAVPNPMSIFNAVVSFNPKRLLTSVLYMAVDSTTSYAAYMEEAELQFLQDGWALDDEEAETLHESRKSAFSYMIQMVNDYNLPGDLTLTEKSVEDFVSWKNNDNLYGRIQFLESNKPVYQQYGGYWLLLADSYYQTEDYAKCLDSLAEYEKLDIHIFRRDYDYANTIPLGICAANELYDNDEYVSYAEKYIPILLNNSNNDDWALKYFAAQTYIDLYNRTNGDKYLNDAYSIVKDNVNYLVVEQRTLNKTYVEPVQTKSIPDGIPEDEKNELQKYNKILNEERKTELPPVSEPLLLNCELLFALTDKIDIHDSEKSIINEILHHNGDALFLTESIDSKFWFDHSESEETEIDYQGNYMIVPVSHLTDNYKITVGTKKSEDEDITLFDDWKLIEVRREKEGELSSYKALFTSDKATKFVWNPGAVVSIFINPFVNGDYESYQYSFLASGTKEEWYDYLKVWEGHKNEWYDYLKVWENSVEFERLK